MYYCIFTGYKWLQLFEIVNEYDMVYKWFDVLKKNHQQIIGYVIMPNHLHAILYFPEPGYKLNKIMGNAKIQSHKMFEKSFDAKGISSEKFQLQKLNYIHRNPVSDRRNLVKDYNGYDHSSASFYETGIIKNH
jgi:REP element-mobilizing transposase RayT